MAAGRLEQSSAFYQPEIESAPTNGADFALSKLSDNKALTPVDQITGLPLAVFMTGEDYGKNSSLSRPPNYHHHFHPRKSPELGFDEYGSKLPRDNPLRNEGLALRYSRGQELPVWLHLRYHDIFHGPELPNDSKSKFTAVVLACAGVVPRQAINLYKPGEFASVSLSDRQHDFIRRRIFFEGASSGPKRSKRDSIGRFIAEYSLQSALSDILTEKEIRKKAKEFMRPKTAAQRAMAGRFILEHTVDASLAELIPIHNEAKKEHMIKNSHRTLGQSVLRFFRADYFPDYFGPLEQKLVKLEAFD